MVKFEGKLNLQQLIKFFQERQLVAYIRDLFGGGAETTGQELYWALLCALRHPQFTEKIRQEISSIVGEKSVCGKLSRQLFCYAVEKNARGHRCSLKRAALLLRKIL